MNREGDTAFFARASAIAIACTGGEEAAEDAVLGVEDGQMMECDGLEAASPPMAREIGDLRGVQVVSGGETGDSESEQLPAVMALAAFRLKSAMRWRGSRCACQQAGGAGEDGAVAAQKEIGDLVLSPGLRTRGLATRTARSAARMRWREGRRP